MIHSREGEKVCSWLGLCVDDDFANLQMPPEVDEPQFEQKAETDD